MLCDGCDRGCHCFCMDPPEPTPPDGDWFCSACLTGNPQVFASREGPTLTMEELSRAAETTAQGYFADQDASTVGRVCGSVVGSICTPWHRHRSTPWSASFGSW